MKVFAENLMVPSYSSHPTGVISLRRAFTLIELLVAISIIALLAAILFPVFGRVRENARRTACLSNARSLALGLAQYSQDFDEKFPCVRYSYDSGESPYPGNKTWDDSLFPYVRNNQVYICRNANPLNTRCFTMNLFVTGWTNYFGTGAATGGSGSYATYGVPNDYYVKNLASIPRASNTLLLVEAYVPLSTNLTACPSGVLLDCYNVRGQYASGALQGGAVAGSKPWGTYTGATRDSSGVVKTGAGTGVHLNDTYNAIFCDGHAKSIPALPPTDGSFYWYPTG